MDSISRNKFKFLILVVLVVQCFVIYISAGSGESQRSISDAEINAISVNVAKLLAEKQSFITTDRASNNQALASRHSTLDVSQLQHIVARELEKFHISDCMTTGNRAVSRQREDGSQRQYTQAVNLTAEEREIQEAAYDTSAYIVSQAIEAGVWNQQNSLDLAEHFTKLPESERDRIRAQLYDAVNRQEVELEAIPLL